MIEHDERVVRVERVIPADAATIFDVLADPRQHPVIDGSGSVRRTRGEPPERLALGSEVRHAHAHRPAVLDQQRGGRVRGRAPHRWRHDGRHVWRYVLEPHLVGPA